MTQTSAQITKVHSFRFPQSPLFLTLFMNLHYDQKKDTATLGFAAETHKNPPWHDDRRITSAPQFEIEVSLPKIL